jgi:aspartate racemase
MKSVGVIGGLGPETTAEFYLEVVFQCQKRNSTQRPLIVIASVPLLFEIERDLIESNIGKERYIPFLVEEARRLEKSGVDFLVMPCNSLHVFIQEIRQSVSIPVLSIVEATAAYLQAHNLKKVGLISTSATVANNVYEDQLQKNGIDFVTPDDLQRAKMDKIIQRLINGQHLNQDRELILEVVKSLSSRGVDSVALACTDLQLLLPGASESAVPVFDTMKVLAESTVETILSHE